MDEEKELEGTIRAIVQSSKGPVTIKDLQRDFYTLENKPIPYAKFGCRNLENFLQSFSSLRVSGSGHYAMVSAAGDASSKHITSLIDRQKSSKKRAGFIAAPRRGRGNFHYQGPPRNSYTEPTFKPRSYSPDEPPKYSNSKPRKYPSAEPPKQTTELSHPRSSASLGSYHRSSATTEPSYHRANAMTEPSYHRSNSTTELSHHGLNSTEEQRTHSIQSHIISNPKQSHNNSLSSRGGYFAGGDVPPRFQPKRQIDAAENVKEQLVVNIKNNERQVVWKPQNRDILITIKTGN